MELKGTTDGYQIPTNLLYESKNANPVKDLDCAALVKLCAADLANAVAWREFLSRYLGKIRQLVINIRQWRETRYSPRLAKDPTIRQLDLEDLVQEVLERLVAHQGRLLKKFEGESEADWLRYLFVIATSVVIDAHRRRQRRLQPDTSLEAADLTVLNRIGLSRYDLKMERSILMQELVALLKSELEEEMADPQRRARYLLVFNLYLFEGLSLSQIACHYGVNLSKSAVEKMMMNIMGRLREKFQAPKR